MEASRIAGFSALSDVPPAELGELAEAMGELEVNPGTSVVTIDDYGTAVTSSRRERRRFGRRERTPCASSARRRFRGDHPASGRAATAGVVASTPMRAVSLSGQDFEHIRRRVPAVEQALRRRGVERASR